MFTYLAVIAALNLCIGYALGVYFGGLPRLSSPVRKEKAKQAPSPDGAEGVTARNRKRSLEWLAGLQLVKGLAGLARRQKHTPATPPQSTVAPNTDTVLSGLASFRKRLSTVGNGIKAAEGTHEAIYKCAGELKQTGVEYLGHASESLDLFGENPATTSAASLKDTLQNHTEQVAKVTAGIDQLVDPANPEKSRDNLLASTHQLDASAAHTQEQVELIAAVDHLPGGLGASPRTTTPAASQPAPAADPPAVGEVDPSSFEDSSFDEVLSGLEAGESAIVGIERLMQATTDYLAESNEKHPLHMAAVAFDPVLPGGGELSSDDRLNRALLELVETSLDAGQQAAFDPEGRVLLLLAGDDQSTASRRCERIRQQVAVTTFQVGSNPIQATVSCGLSDSSRTSDRGKLLEFLAESIDEARRLGANRTFHHDGKFPAPIVPQTIEVAPRTVEV